MVSRKLTMAFFLGIVTFTFAGIGPHEVKPTVSKSVVGSEAQPDCNGRAKTPVKCPTAQMCNQANSYHKIAAWLPGAVLNVRFENAGQPCRGTENPDSSSCQQYDLTESNKCNEKIVDGD